MVLASTFDAKRGHLDLYAYPESETRSFVSIGLWAHDSPECVEVFSVVEGSEAWQQDVERGACFDVVEGVETFRASDIEQYASSIGDGGVIDITIEGVAHSLPVRDHLPMP